MSAPQAASNVIKTLPTKKFPSRRMINSNTYWKTTSKIVAIGRNYADHIAELGNQRPTKPFFFLKPWTSIHPPVRFDKDKKAYCVNTNPIPLPAGTNVHYEIELAVIMSKNLHNFKFAKKVLEPEKYEAIWKSAIFGYAIGIDLTARNLQEEAKQAGLPWTAAKGYNSFLPLSAFIHKSKIPDPHDLRLELKVNGKTVQDDNTNLMLYKIPDQFEAITDVMTLQTGDIVLTGTPKGVGQIVDGDVMTASCYVGDELIESFEVKARDRVNPDGTPY